MPLMPRISILSANASDGPDLRRAIVALQEHERALHDTRRPGEDVADAYLAQLLGRTAVSGAILKADLDGLFAGFVAGWVEESDAIAETESSNRHGLIADICVLPEYRTQGIGALLLAAMERRLAAFGVERIRVVALSSNSLARASYERAGFHPYEITYEKKLD
ncbi:GNAT family N-acetyltransferase [Methylocystis bryophila]|uniref:N-acetyltransferase domain-containing protein n=1 Tax=Methylocystis bryophila TaxID=655015 RepID=A0A1W6MVL5_9HYPH|nr:N-acetyltransferase [Methylocystis bryophila]ARN81556.1 hypothetical protein B1812_11285 [Methylocystis bryophila]BDV37585.1 hypothetical protein DSM21852_08380 [Methylocystis bryophila]